MNATSVAARLQGVSLTYGSSVALDDLTLDLPAGRMVGLIGPDGVGKSSLMSLLAGARVIQEGRIEVLAGNMADKRHRDVVCPRIAYMPQGLARISIRRSRSRKTCSSSLACSVMAPPSAVDASTT